MPPISHRPAPGAVHHPDAVTPSPDLSPLWGPAALLAATVPTLLALQQPPSTTLLNQCLAVVGWGGVAAVLAPRRLWAATGWLLAALALMAVAVFASWQWGSLPGSLSWQALGLLAGAAVMVVAGADVARGPRGPRFFVAFAWGLLVAGVLACGVAVVQAFRPDLADGDWIAYSSLTGRAIGNLRQPNHLCSLQMWALVAAVALHALRRLPLGALWAVALPLLFSVELTASRTGAAGLALLLLWGLIDRGLPRGARILLLLTPLLYAAAYGAMGWYGEYSQQAFGAAARVAESGLSDLTTDGGSPNSRLNIFRNALALISAHPLAGVGFGEFNFAWSLTAFPGRPTAFFDHTHNLPLQLAVELGLPLAAAVLLLLLVALVQGAQAAVRARGEAATAGRAALVLVLLVGLHSLVEYPLWYAYFLMPAALAWGFLAGTPGAGPASGGAPATGASAGLPGGAAAGLAAGLLMGAAGALAIADYQRVVVIYAPPPGAAPLSERIAAGQHSPLFAHHADYAAATNPARPESAALAFVRAPHSLLDTRLMVAWAQHLAALGDVDRARWLAQRLREFRNPDARAFFAPCDAGDTTAFQCQPPQAAHGWREFAALPPRILPPAAQGSPARQ